MTPHLPQDWEYMNLKNIRAHESNFSIYINRLKNDYLEVTITKREGQVLVKKRIKNGDTISVKL
jgi:hypothetical protein